MINKFRSAYSSAFDIYFIQRPCLFLVLPTFTQDIRKKHSCSEQKNRQDYRHQRFIYCSVVAVEHKQYSYADGKITVFHYVLHLYKRCGKSPRNSNHKRGEQVCYSYLFFTNEVKSYAENQDIADIRKIR